MRIAILVPALFFTFATAVARADGSDPATAEALFREGRSAAEAGNYAVACPKFEESHRLDPAPGTLLNLADCEEHRGQILRALQHFHQLHAELPATDERKPIAAARARALELRAPELRIVPTAAAAPSVMRQDVVVVAPRETTQPAPRDGRRTAAFVLGGVGFASVAVGTIFGIVALSSLSASNAGCNGNVCSSQDAVNQFNRSHSFAIAADVSVGIGVVLIGTALVLALTGGRS